jgi:hypothetical protein
MNSSIRIEEIFGQNSLIEESVALIEAIAARALATNSSELLDYLSRDDALPLQRYGLSHVKRIRRSSVRGEVDVLLLPKSSSEDLAAVLERLSLLKPGIIIDTLTVQVSQYAPSYREEFEALGKHWPINYHPSEEDRERKKGFSEAEFEVIKGFIDLLQEEDVASMSLYGCKGKAAMIVNPGNNQVRRS